MRKRWRAVPGWPGYKVASVGGEVRSVPRRLADGREHGGGLLAQTPDRDRYLYVTLADGGRRWRVSVAELVLTAFDRPRPDGLEACHGPAGSQVNDLVALRWDTRRENERDKMRERKRKREEIGTGVCSPSKAVTPVTGGLR